VALALQAIPKSAGASKPLRKGCLLIANFSFYEKQRKQQKYQ